MRLILLGPPGAGKGTMAKILSRRHGVPHISAGDLLRGHIQRRTELGKKASDYVGKGELVPDGLVIDMIRERLNQKDASSGFILDGFPRTEGQALALDDLLREAQIVADYALNFDASAAKIIERLSGRRTCGACGEIYHLKNIPPKVNGVCDRCGGKLVQREDDTEETVRTRLEIYRRETEPLIAYYKVRGLLRDVPADLEVMQLEPVIEDLVR